MESKSKTVTTTVINVINSCESTVIKKTIKREIYENNQIKEITTTVEEFKVDQGDDIDQLLGQLDQSPLINPTGLGDNSNVVTKTIKRIESVESVETKPITIKSTDPVKSSGSELIPKDKLLDENDKENRSTDQLIAKPVGSTIGKDEQSAEKLKRQSTESQQFNQKCLERHNYYRSLHGFEPLTINEKLNELASDWANHLASIGSLSHRPNNKYGENVYWISIDNVQGNQPVDSWYDEIKNYNWDSATFTSGTGHFTQVVWKNSKQLGIGRSISPRGTFVVCNYDPPGNFIGQFKENVLPLIKK